MQPYELIRSGRRTLALEVRGGRVIVRAPYPDIAGDDQPLCRGAHRLDRARSGQTGDPCRRASRADGCRAGGIYPAGESLPAAACGVLFRADGLCPTQVRITGARTRFGSCSSQGHICFSWRLMQYPPEAIDYVVVHELAHLRYMNHGAEFYALIARYLPDWKARRTLLRA